MMPPPVNPMWEAHLEWLRRMYGPGQSAAAHGRRPATSVSECEAHEARRSEWAARPLGRLGRRLLADLDPYLEFFAIARAA
jgi:hypothetical protein